MRSFNSEDNRFAWFWFAGLFLLALRPIESFDTFWQLQSGKYIWQTGAFLYKDTFSVAAGVFRLEHCWLHDLVLYTLYSLGGYVLLGLLKPLIVAVCGFLLLRENLRRGELPLIVVPTLILCLYASHESWLVRPQLWTFLFGVVFLILLYRGREEGWRAWLWMAPVMLVWANMHAACIFGFALFAAFWVGELWRTARRQSSWRSLGVLTFCGALTFAAAFVNPYGSRIPLGQLQSHLNQTTVLTGSAPAGMMGNMEWLPPTFAQVPWFYVVMALWAGTILWRLLIRRIEAAELAYFLGFSYMGFSQIRHTTLVSMMAGFFLPLAIGELLVRYPRIADRAAGMGRRGWIPGLALLGVLVIGAAAQGSLGVGLKASAYPVAATDFLKERQLPGNLYNAYDWGGYLMWRLYPDTLVFVDGRSDSNEHFVASSQIENAWAGWSEALDTYGINTIITRTCYYDTGAPLGLIDGLVRHPRWSLVYRDEVAVVYLRRGEGIAPQEALAPTLAYETMLAEAQRLYSEDPRYRSPALLALGRASFHLQRFPQALGYYRQYLEIEPDNREARLATSILEARGIGQ
jgi:hypothetical protein